MDINFNARNMADFHNPQKLTGARLGRGFRFLTIEEAAILTDEARENTDRAKIAELLMVDFYTGNPRKYWQRVTKLYHLREDRTFRTKVVV